MCTGEFNAGGNPAMDWHPMQGGLEILLVASSYRKRDKLRPDEPLGSYRDFTYLPIILNQWNLILLPNINTIPYCIPRTVRVFTRAPQERPSQKMQAENT